MFIGLKSKRYRQTSAGWRNADKNVWSNFAKIFLQNFNFQQTKMFVKFEITEIFIS